jgi:hypothetical protein
MQPRLQTNFHLHSQREPLSDGLRFASMLPPGHPLVLIAAALQDQQAAEAARKQPVQAGDAASSGGGGWRDGAAAAAGGSRPVEGLQTSSSRAAVLGKQQGKQGVYNVATALSRVLTCPKCLVVAFQGCIHLESWLKT